MIMSDAESQIASLRRPSELSGGGLANGTVGGSSPSADVLTASVRVERAKKVVHINNVNDKKAIVSGNGVSVSLHLAEPVLFLRDFDRHDKATHGTVLRGSLRLQVTKPVKLKKISLKLHGKSEIEWQHGQLITKHPSPFLC